MKRGYLQAGNVRLAYVDFGGEGPGLFLLHGLMGRATTWAETSRWLTPHYHVVGLDQRGHGWSDKPDRAYGVDLYVADAAAAIEQLGLAPAVVIGHSMGALVAWVLAARHPDLVHGLVLEDMEAERTPATDVDGFRRWFSDWPVPFPTVADVRAYFGRMRPGLADYFMEVVTEGPDGYRPLFRFEDMLETLAAMGSRSYWTELEQLRCPTLVVRGAESGFPRPQLQEMARRAPKGRYVEVPAADHTVHYDNPDGWRSAAEPFLLELSTSRWS